jgi:hypothetical protein
MLSRALILAAVTLLIGCIAAVPAQAQNLEAGKSPAQIFAGACTACHKSPRGLLKTVPAGSLQGFLRQHYTTSPEMAALLSAFLVSNGAADTRYVGSQPKQGKDTKLEATPSGPPEQFDRFGRRLRPGARPQEAARPEVEPEHAARPDADGVSPQTGPGRRGRNARRQARPEMPEGGKPAAEGQAPAQAAREPGHDGRKSAARQRLSKRGKPGSEEPPKMDAAKTEAVKTDAVKTDAAKDKTDAAKEEPSKGDAVKDDKPPSEPAKGETAKEDGSKPEGTKPSGEDKSDSAKIEAPKEAGSAATPVLRADPVTPAPPASPAASASVSTTTPEPTEAPSAPAAPPAVTAVVPRPPVAPAGSPIPPISQ